MECKHWEPCEYTEGVEIDDSLCIVYNGISGCRQPLKWRIYYGHSIWLGSVYSRYQDHWLPLSLRTGLEHQRAPNFVTHHMTADGIAPLHSLQILGSMIDPPFKCRSYTVHQGTPNPVITVPAYVLSAAFNSLKILGSFKILGSSASLISQTLYISVPIYVSTVPADVPAPNGAGPSACTVLTEKFDMLSLANCKQGWSRLVIHCALYIIRNL